MGPPIEGQGPSNHIVFLGPQMYTLNTGITARTTKGVMVTVEQNRYRTASTIWNR